MAKIECISLTVKNYAFPIIKWLLFPVFASTEKQRLPGCCWNTTKIANANLIIASADDILHYFI